MNRKIKVILSLALLGILTMLPGSSQAQVNSNLATVTLTAGVTPYIGISVSAAAVSFSLVPGAGPTAGAPTLTVNANWSLAAGPTNMSLWGSFAAAATALTDGGWNDIPSANVLGAVNGGGAAAFTGTGPFGGAAAGLQIWTQAVAGPETGTRSDTLDLSIDLTSQPLLPSGTYVGTLNLQAQAM